MCAYVCVWGGGVLILLSGVNHMTFYGLWGSFDGGWKSRAPIMKCRALLVEERAHLAECRAGVMDDENLGLL